MVRQEAQLSLATQQDAGADYVRAVVTPFSLIETCIPDAVPYDRGAKRCQMVGRKRRDDGIRSGIEGDTRYPARERIVGTKTNRLLCPSPDNRRRNLREFALGQTTNPQALSSNTPAGREVSQSRVR